MFSLEKIPGSLLVGQAEMLPLKKGVIFKTT